MHWRHLAIGTFLAVTIVAPADGADDDPPLTEPHRFTVNVAAGSHLLDGGHAQALSFGYTVWRGATVLVSLERSHVPTRVTTFSGGFGATRGGTLTSISGEFRYAPWQGTRVAPFVLAGLGAGVSRPNVNDIFPNKVTNTANVLYAGGGLIFPIGPSFGVSVDAKFQISAERGELGAMAPIRAGVTWRF